VDVLHKYQIKDRDAEHFFDNFATGNLIFFKQVLMDRYGKQNKIKGLNNRNNADETAVAAIKNKLMMFMRKHSYSLSTVYRMCDKSGTKNVTIVDFQNGLKACMDANEANKLFQFYRPR